MNVPVRDIAVATRFFEPIGCRKNPQFSDHQASSMGWSDTTTFQLLARDYFATCAPKPVGDARATCRALLALTLDAREAVDAIATAAASAGGKADFRARMDLGWLYNRAFEDPDGNVFEAVWTDLNAMPKS